MSSVITSGATVGPGIVAFLPNPNHFVYVQDGFEFAEQIKGRLIGAGDDARQLKAIDSHIVSCYQQAKMIPQVLRIFVGSCTCFRADNSIRVEYEGVRMRIIFRNADIYAAVEGILSSAGLV